MIRFASTSAAPGSICPVIACDSCGDLIDAAHPGHVLYDPHDDRAQWHVHRGTCGRAVERAAERHLYWHPMSEWLAQLVYNHAHPLPDATWLRDEMARP